MHGLLQFLRREIGVEDEGIELRSRPPRPFGAMDVEERQAEGSREFLGAERSKVVKTSPSFLLINFDQYPDSAGCTHPAIKFVAVRLLALLPSALGPNDCFVSSIFATTLRWRTFAGFGRHAGNPLENVVSEKDCNVFLFEALSYCRHLC